MPSKLVVVAIAVLLCSAAPIANAQCKADMPEASVFEKTSLVIDVRPDEINQFKGKSSFKNEARIVLINMNPFLFSYTLKVDQTEIQDTGFLNFLKLLGSPVSDLIGSVASSSRSLALSETSGGNLGLLIERTDKPPTAPHSSCEEAQRDDAKAALKELAEVRDKVIKEQKSTEKAVSDAAEKYKGARKAFLDRKGVIFDSSAESNQLCNTANELRVELEKPANKYPDLEKLGEALIKVRDFRSMVEELKSSALDYESEYENCPARAKGLGYADNLVRLANELAKLGAAYETKINALINETKGYDALVSTIANLNNRLLQREYTVNSRYDISSLDITATAVPLGDDSGLPNNNSTAHSGRENTERAQRAGNAIAQENARIIDVGATESAEGVRVLAPHQARFQARSAEAKAEEKDGDESNTEKGGGAKEIKTTGTIGARRFEISAGMMVSSLDRKEFQTVQGYPRNEQGEIIDPATGNPTNDRNLTKIVGISEQSSRRFAPLAMLHYRLPFSRNIFASVGFTGKRDDYGVDLEYLIGPSVLYKSMFLTFGGYAGKQQKLAGDLFEGSPIDGDIPVRKNYKWGFGFSFTYKIPLGSRDPGN